MQEESQKKLRGCITGLNGQTMARQPWRRGTVNLNPVFMAEVKAYLKRRGYRSFTHYVADLIIGDMANHGVTISAATTPEEKAVFAAQLASVPRMRDYPPVGPTEMRHAVELADKIDAEKKLPPTAKPVISSPLGAMVSHLKPHNNSAQDSGAGRNHKGAKTRRSDLGT